MNFRQEQITDTNASSLQEEWETLPMATFAESCAFSAKRLCAREVCSITNVLLIVSVNETKVQKRTTLLVCAQSEETDLQTEERNAFSLSPEARGAACVDNSDFAHFANCDKRGLTSSNKWQRRSKNRTSSQREVQHFLSQQLHQLTEKCSIF